MPVWHLPNSAYMPISLVLMYIYVCEIYDKWDPWEVNGYKMETLFISAL